MRFALFYEIPVATPVGRRTASTAPTRTRSSRRVAGEQCGWDAFWTVEHHFLEEYSHCSNPEVLYGAIAAPHRAHAARLRRAPDAQAVQPPGAHGGVGGGARPDLRRPRRLRHRSLVDARRARGLRHRPARDARDVGRRRSGTSSAAGPTRSTSSTASTGRCRSGACSPSRSRSRTRRSGARPRSEDGHRQIGELGLGLCSFAVGVPPEEVKKKIDIYRAAVGRCNAAARQVRARPGRDLHDGAVRADAAKRRGTSRASPSSGTRRRARG